MNWILCIIKYSSNTNILLWRTCKYLYIIAAAPNTALTFSNIYQNCELDDNARTRGSGKTADDDNDVDVDEKIHNHNPYGDVYINEKSNSYIAVQNLGNEISEKSKNENDGFKKEYAVGWKAICKRKWLNISIF